MTRHHDDHLIRAIALNGRARVAAALTTATAEELRRIHDPSPQVAAALARLSTGAVLLASALEKVTQREPILTLETNGGGPAGLLVATASPAGWVRAVAANPLAATPKRHDGILDVAAVVGNDGQLVVTRDPGHGEPYRGVVELSSGDLARDLAVYLSESEQSPSAVVFGVLVVPEGRVDVSGGMLIQLFPGVSDDEADVLTDRLGELGALSSRIADGDGPREWLATVFPEGCTIVEEVPVRFHCGCSSQKVEAALKLLGVGEIRAAMDEDNDRKAVLTCGFCHHRYTVAHDRLRELLAEVEAERRSTGAATRKRPRTV
jgi:molecular chaperone Hsp33